MKIFSGCLLLVFSAIFSFLQASDYRTVYVGIEKKEDCGLVGGNVYSEVAFLNPTVHRSAVKYEEFDSFMPLKDSENRSTYNEDIAKIRLCFKPGMRAWTASGRRVYLVGDKFWKIEKIQSGIKYSRNWSRRSSRITTDVIARLNEKKAEITIEAVLTNHGRNDCMVEFLPNFTFLRDRELTLLIPRSYSDYINGKQTNFSYGEKVVLDNSKGRPYFWRRAARNDNTGFIDFVSRERIPFTNANIRRVDMFGFVQLPGKTNIVWDLAGLTDKNSLKYIEFGWENRTGDTLLSYEVLLKRGESKKIKFRVITVKGISRFDALSENMLVGYGVENDCLKIEMAPLSPLGISTLQGEVVHAHSKQVLVKQKSELAEMHPFNCGRMDWRSTAVFERGSSYPIDISLHTAEGKLLLKAAGVIVP